MKRTVNIFSLLLILLTGNVFAQQDADFEARLAKLERDIANLKTVAERYNRQNELLLLATAHKEYLAARKAYESGRIQLAKFHYFKSLNIVKNVAQRLVFTPAAKMKSELKVKIEKADRLVNNNPNNEEGRYLLSKARLYQQRMDVSLQHSDYQNAYKFYKIATYFANRILQLYNSGDNLKPAERYKMLADNIRKLYNEVSGEAYKSSNTSAIMVKVDRLIAQAKAEHEKGAYYRAFANLQIAEKLLYRIIDLKTSGSNLSEQTLRNDIFSLRRYIDSIEKKVNINGNNTQRSLLNKARQYARGAERDVSNGAYAAAKKKVSMGQKLATKALQMQMAAGSDRNGLVQKRLAEVTRLLRLQENRVSSVNDPSITYMHNEAKNLLKEAENLSKQGKESEAFFNIQIALKFIYGIKVRLDKNEKESASKQTLQMQINELERAISGLDTAQNTQKVKVLNDLLNKAKLNFQSGKYEIAADLVRIIKVQMQTLSH